MTPFVEALAQYGALGVFAGCLLYAVIRLHNEAKAMRLEHAAERAELLKRIDALQEARIADQQKAAAAALALAEKVNGYVDKLTDLYDRIAPGVYRAGRPLP